MDKNKLKIYINGRFLTQQITGVQRYSHELVKAFDVLLSKKSNLIENFEFIIIAPKKNILHHLKLKHIKIRFVGILSGHFWEQFELPFICKDGILFCPGNTAPLISLLSKQKMVITIHDLSFKYFPIAAYSFSFKVVYTFLTPFIISYANKIITVSNSELESISIHYSKVKQKIKSIQNGGLSENYLHKISHNDKSDSFSIHPTVLYVGSLNPRKNLEGLIKSLKLLNKTTKINGIIVGASGKSFIELKSTLIEDTSEFIEFKGQIENTEELIRLYQNATCFVFPSFYEASPLPPIEAMSCGCPVIASDIPSLKERCGDAALYCKAENINDIAEKINLIISDSKIRNQLIKKGYERSQYFTWDKCASSTLKVINDIK